MIPKVHGMLLIDENGVANIYLNENDPPERRKKALKHELLHYINDDPYIPEESAEKLNRIREKDKNVNIHGCGDGDVEYSCERNDTK